MNLYDDYVLFLIQPRLQDMYQSLFGRHFNYISLEINLVQFFEFLLI